MSRVNQFQEGHGVPFYSWPIPAKKRKNRRKGFRLSKEIKVRKLQTNNIPRRFARKEAHSAQHRGQFNKSNLGFNTLD